MKTRKQPIDQEVLKRFKATYPVKVSIIGTGYFVADQEDSYLINNYSFWLKKGEIIRLNSGGVPYISTPTP